MHLYHTFNIDENHAGLEVNKKYKEEYRFPVEMLVRGQNYSGIESTLNKPHGKKMIMELIIKFLLKGPKQYKPFVNHMVKQEIWSDLRDALEILLLDGVIQIIFKNQKPRKSVDWIPKIIQLDPRAIETLSKFINKDPDHHHEMFKLKESVKNLLSNIDSPIKENIFQWIEGKQIVDQKGNMITDYKSFKKYKSIILTVSNYISLKEAEKEIPLRHLSNQTWNNPSMLGKYKEEIADAAGITVQELNFVLLPDINNTLHAPLITISPIEHFQNLLNNLFNLLESKEQQDTLLVLLEEMENCINYLDSIISNVSDQSKELDDLVRNYDTLKRKIIEEDFSNAQCSVTDIISSVKTLRKSLLEIDVIRRQFELIVLKDIGSGSFARVYKVFDPEENKIVACKVLFPRSHFKQVYGNDGDEYILRFKREVRLLSKELQHKNIVKVEKIQVEGSPFWFTMPLASYSLEKWIKDNRDASENQRIQIFKQILSGIKYLHKEKKYHRDLAPNNILLYETNTGLEVKIADFGLAKDPESLSFFTGLSKRGYGQQEFTDPEQQINLAESTNLSDIYSLGALLYYLLSGKLPKKRKYVPVGCQRIVLKAMDTRRRRYQTVDEFEEDFIKYLQEKAEVLIK